MQALILAGGEGTRLRPLTLTLPKPVIPLVDRPFIRYMVDWLARHGVDDVVLACGFLAAGVRDVLGEGGDGGPRLRYVEEPDARGTAGAIKFAERFLDERFLVLNGDVLTDLDLGELIRQHDEREAEVTIALYPVADPSAYGLVRRRDDGEIVEFLEKPDPEQIDTDEINAGAYVLERSVLDLIPAEREVSIEREVFPKLVGNGLYGRRLDGYWMDIGTPERYLCATYDILERTVETDAGDRLDGRGMLIEDEVELDDAAELLPPAVLEARASVGSGATVGPLAVLSHGCSVADRATVERSAVHRGCRVAAEARVTEAILAAGVEVGEGALVPAGAVIGEGARIGPGAELEPEARVEPGAEVN
jgi:mannose-1-phosphate guanylyltransferase